jgi:hypothetical protein
LTYSPYSLMASAFTNKTNLLDLSESQIHQQSVFEDSLDAPFKAVPKRKPEPEPIPEIDETKYDNDKTVLEPVEH